jgi:hypothetical protein
MVDMTVYTDLDPNDFDPDTGKKKPRCIRCGRILKYFDEFAPIHECDLCRRDPLVRIQKNE